MLRSGRKVMVGLWGAGPYYARPVPGGHPIFAWVGSPSLFQGQRSRSPVSKSISERSRAVYEKKVHDLRVARPRVPL